jgi:hypothetical protein
MQPWGPLTTGRCRAGLGFRGHDQARLIAQQRDLNESIGTAVSSPITAGQHAAGLKSGETGRPIAMVGYGRQHLPAPFFVSKAI